MSSVWNFESLGEDRKLVLPFLRAFQISVGKSEVVPNKHSLSLDDAAYFFDYLHHARAPTRVLTAVAISFQAEVLSNTDIHSLALQYSPDASSRNHLIKAYFQLMDHTELHASRSALLKAAKAGKASLLAVFGGQGTHNSECLIELRRLYNTYQPFLRSLIKVTSSLLQEVAASSGDSCHYEFDLLRWIEQPDTAPDKTDIATAIFSFPINGLLALAHYCIACCVLGLHPGQMKDCLTGITGHSQGIIVAAAVAASDSWDTFTTAAMSAVELLFWIGLRSHEQSSHLSVPVQSALIGGTGKSFSSCMLSIRGLDFEGVQRILDTANLRLSDDQKAHIALQNSRDRIVIAGPTRTLRGVCTLLDGKKAPEGLDQGRIPFPHRKPNIDCEMLPISAPFHCSHLQGASKVVLDQVKDTLFAGLTLTAPLYHTTTGMDISQASGENLTKLLVEMIMLEKVDWRAACIHPGQTHILDFGPSRMSGALHDYVEGSGVRTIIASELVTSSDIFGGKQELFSKTLPPMARSWTDLYGPKITTNSDGSKELSTRMSQLFGRPPIIVAGMTPTTVPWDFVSVVINAGYHIELAGGGYSQAAEFEDAIHKLAASLPPDQGITCNLIYVSPRALAWQIPLIRKLIQEGVPIHGLTIGAGVPSSEVAKEYIETLGLKHISFKPGSIQAIHQVLSIADANPNFPIGLQWTGGRAGGHHSYEDFHAPLLKTYELIRRRGNLVLLVGGGFGDAQGMLPYFTGEWSEALSYPRMPIDGILMGSRLMAAKEAHTSSKVKELIVQTKGTSEKDWHKTYQGSAGGVITVQSEMGEPIHKIATKGVMLWRDLDTTVFSIKEPAKRLAALHKRRDEIVRRLNSEYAKPWFAVNTTGDLVEIHEMTYLECLQRIVTLMYLSKQKRWVHHSYKPFFDDFVSRMQERLSAESEYQRDLAAEPLRIVDEIVRCYPQAGSTLLYPQDASFFIGLCKRRGQKPVNFIPRLDEDFENWFKKDSLWQAEDIEAVMDQDPQRVCIIHGPVAAKYTNSVDDSAGDILNTISRNLVSLLDSTLPSQSKDEMSIKNASMEIVNDTVLHHFISLDSNTNKENFRRNLICDNKAWIDACLGLQHVYHEKQCLPNNIRTAFTPVKGDKVAVNYHSGTRSVKSIALSTRAADFSYPPFYLSSADGKRITLTLQAPQVADADANKISFNFTLRDNKLEDVTEQRNELIRIFYAGCWSIPLDKQIKTPTEFNGGIVTLSRKMVQDFFASFSKFEGNHMASRHPKSLVPLDLGIVVAWPALTKALLLSNIAGDIFRLLHRSNSFELCQGAEALTIGDILETSSCITKIVVQPTGKLVEVLATIQRGGAPVMKVTSAFFIQGKSATSDATESVEETKMRLTVDSPRLQAIVLSRTWLEIPADNRMLLGKKLLFTVQSRKTQAATSDLSTLTVRGEVYLERDNGSHVEIGKVDFFKNPCAGNPVVQFLQRYGKSLRVPTPLTNPGWDSTKSWLITMPDSGKEYSRVSADRNPIHVCPTFAGFARLPGPITHGMYTSALVRMAVEAEIAKSDDSRFRNWSTSFEGMVRAGDVLRIEMQHVAMVEGKMVFDIDVYNNESHDKVMRAKAEVEQENTAYIFCGQGSQVKGMGMALYETDSVARGVWDEGDRYLLDCFGFSLLDLVRRDPTELTVYFGGPKGRKIRANYLAMTQKTFEGGLEIICPVIQDLGPETESHTFRDPRGLLFSTQFAQPVITLMNLAEIASLKTRGLVQEGAMFAGHSLGEYSALAAFTGCFNTLGELLRAVFYRGLVMQVAMTRDAAGRTDYAMVAANPSRVGKNFNEESLKLLVHTINASTGLLLEVVNYNIAGQQYVCAGHLEALWILGQACDQLATDRSLSHNGAEDIQAVVRQLTPKVKHVAKPIELARGRATVPLTGIDIPFHSSHLRAGIDVFRECLTEMIREEAVVPDRLIGKFVPNVMGTPFSLERSYVEEAARITGSKILKDLLVTWV